MVFSTNQVRQFYVVTSNITKSDINKHAAGTVTQNPGATALVEFDDWGQHQDPKTYEFLYVNALGELGHSDLIHRENIRKVTKTPAAKLRMYLPTIEVTNTLSATDYQTGDVFYMNFSFPGFLNATDEEVETKTIAMRYNYNKVGREMQSTDANYNDWGAQMAEAITLAFNAKKNLDNDLLSATGSGNTVTIVGKAGQPWYVGVADNKPNQIVIDNLTWENWHDDTLTSLPLENNSRVGVYGTAVDQTGQNNNYVGNGKLTADLEYFCMGERGDQYRNVGWPNVIHTAYMINNPSDSAEYDYLDIHFYFQGEGVRSDKSEKQLTLVCEAGSGLLDEFYETLCGGSEPTPTPTPDPTPDPTPGPEDEGEGVVYTFKSYNDAQGTTQYGAGTVISQEKVGNNYRKVEVLTNTPDTSFVGNHYLIDVNANTDGVTLYELFNEDKTSANIWVTVQPE